MDYNDDDSVEERSFKLNDDSEENFVDDIDELDAPEEIADFGAGEEETDTGY